VTKSNLLVAKEKADNPDAGPFEHDRNNKLSSRGNFMKTCAASILMVKANDRYCQGRGHYRNWGWICVYRRYNCWTAHCPFNSHCESANWNPSQLQHKAYEYDGLFADSPLNLKFWKEHGQRFRPILNSFNNASSAAQVRLIYLLTIWSWTLIERPLDVRPLDSFPAFPYSTAWVVYPKNPSRAEALQKFS
jgi:hypothetical protein